MNIIDFISQPWHWSISGAAIALVVFLLTWMGRSFGVSTTFKDICSAAGAGKKIPFFNIDLRTEHWRLAFVLGGLIGGIIAANFLSSPEAVQISEATISSLGEAGVDYPAADHTGRGFIPTSVFDFSLTGILLALAGGFLVGFGARYGDGCTSGHAISGLAHLQVPSLLTVIGFFIGGLIMTHFLLPFLFSL